MKEQLEAQINQWQTKWQSLQDLIAERIKNLDYQGAFRDQCSATTLKNCIKDAYKILENQEECAEKNALPHLVCSYSRAMNQSYPRLCIECGKPENKKQDELSKE